MVDGTVWTTNKDGIIATLLSAEITARMGRDPGEIYRELARELGEPAFDRVDAPATPEQKARAACSQRASFVMSALCAAFGPFVN